MGRRHRHRTAVGAVMNHYEPGDQVEVNIIPDCFESTPPIWVPAVVTSATDSKHGWTGARTLSDSQHPGISRSPGWNQDEIRRRTSHG